MNKRLVSREAILSASKEIVIQSGLQAINMRGIANKCGVSVGSVYNYFPSKGDLVIATIEAVWSEIICDFKPYISKADFSESVNALFESILVGSRKYPSFFSMHAISVTKMDRNKGRGAMESYFSHIKKELLRTLEGDMKVREGAFSEEFTKHDFVDFVFGNLVSLFIEEKASCSLLLEIIRRTIY